MQKYVNIDENVMLLSDLLIVKVDGGGGRMEHKWTIFCYGVQLQFLKLVLDSTLHPRFCIYFCIPWSLVDI